MEHQLLPQGASFTDEDRVQYHGGSDYLGIPFLRYPQHAGFDFLVLNSNVPVDLNSLLENLPTVEFWQAWLFCGLLHEILHTIPEELTGKSLYQHTDFVRVSTRRQLSGTENQTKTDEFVTTAKLNGLLEQWGQLILPKLSLAEDQYLHMRTCISNVATQVLVLIGGSLAPNVRQNICSTVEALSLWIHFVFSDQPYAQTLGCAAPLSMVMWHKTYWRTQKEDRIESMRQIGWCPNHAFQLSKKYDFTQVLLYLEKLDKRKNPIRQNRHQHCDVSECRALIPGSGSHHRYPNCDCHEVEIHGKEKSNLLEILKANRIPVIRIQRLKNEIKLHVIPASKGSTYTAISHVWADGLGNKEANALRRCQVDYIYDRLQALNTLLGNGELEICVWIDTLCCPIGDKAMKLNALALMKETYTNAVRVLVLDAELERTDHKDLDYLEILARLTHSTWMQRLWTLQEAFFAQTLWVQFKSQAVNIDALIKEHDIREQRVESRLLYDYMKSGYWAIRTRQAKDPPNAQFWIYSLAYTIPGRSVTVPSDEGICLSTLLDLDLKKIAGETPEYRMQQFWRLLSESQFGIPDHIIFGNGPKLLEPGFRWAPSTLLTGDSASVLRTFKRPSLKISRLGAEVIFPGLRLSTIIPHIPKRAVAVESIYVRDSRRRWHQLGLGKNDTSLLETMVAMVEHLTTETNDSPRQDSPVQTDFCRLGIIASEYNEDAVFSGHVLLVEFAETNKDDCNESPDSDEDQSLFVHRLSPAVLGAVDSNISKLHEAIYQHLERVSAVRPEMLNMSNAKILARQILMADRDGFLRAYISSKGRNDPETYLRIRVEEFLDGTLALSGKLLPVTQRWCVD